TLIVHERTAPVAEDTSAQRQLFDDRFPADIGRFRVSTLQDELELIAGLNRSTGRQAGIYPEIKDPAWHIENGIDLTHLVMTALDDFGYLRSSEAAELPRAVLQCFDAAELRRIRSDLNPSIPLVQLLTDDDDMSEEGLASIAGYAQGIGPALSSLVGRDGDAVVSNERCRTAQSYGLLVHPYTFRRDRLPSFSSDFESLLRFFIADVGVDGIFTDFPDIAVAVIHGMNLN
ncbi:MAG: glycerophosphodiester phosphodiesterase family protein, partial [Gammaproteobacteria bacterium]